MASRQTRQAVSPRAGYPAQLNGAAGISITHATEITRNGEPVFYMNFHLRLKPALRLVREFFAKLVARLCP